MIWRSFRTIFEPRARYYWVVGLGLIALYAVSRGSEWQSSAHFHTVMESLSTFLALIVGCLTLVRYYTKKETLFLLIGAGFLGTAFLDGYHAIVTSEFFQAFMPSAAPSLIPWSWLASRQFLSVLMFLSWFAWYAERRFGARGSVRESVIYGFTAGFTLLGFLFFAFVPLPAAYHPNILFQRPEEFAPAIFLGLALAGFLHKGGWRKSAFEHWLVLSLIVGLAGQVAFMSISSQLFDLPFDAAHGLKMASYLCVLTGLVVNMYSIFQQEAKIHHALAKNFGRLRKSERKFRGLIEGSVQGMCIRQNNKIVYANEALAQIFGYSRQQLVAMDVYDLVPPHAAERIREVEGKPNVANLEIEGRRRDGSQIWYTATGSNIEWEGGYARLISYRDVTERKNIGDALRKHEERLRLITDNLPVLIAYIDREFHYQFVNNTATVWYNRKRSEIIGRHIHEVLESDRWQRTDELLTRVFAGDRQSFKGLTPYGDGNTRDVEIDIVPDLDSSDRVVGAIVLVIDVSERNAVQEQLRQAQKMEAVGQLTGGVAHDFNNLLAVILGNIELARERIGGDENIEALLDKAIASSRRGAELTQRLLAFSRQQVLAPKIVDLNRTITGTTDLLGHALGDDIRIVNELADDLWHCQVDPSQVESALLNLALNARDAMPRGGVLTIKTSNATLEESEAGAGEEVEPGDYTLLSVSDTGGGIPPENLKRIFEPFFTTKDIGQGSGLGLSMIFGFVKQSGGHMTARSKLGEGTTINIYLPRSSGASLEAIQETTARNLSVRHNQTVFVVEDDSDLRGLAVALLKSLGYDVLAADQGSAALELVRQGREFDLLLTDVVLPGRMSGPELVEEVRRFRPGTKALYMSGYGETTIKEGEPFLQKPFSKRDLAAKIRDILNSSAA